MTPVNDDNHDARVIRTVVDEVRARWRRLAWLRGATRAGLALALVLGVGVLAALAMSRVPLALAVLGPVVVLGLGAALWWATRGLGTTPSDRQIARFIEEHDHTLDDRLASAVDTLAAPSASPISSALVADAARRVSDVDSSAVVSDEALRRAGMRAAGAGAFFLVVLLLGRDAARDVATATAVVFRPGVSEADAPSTESPAPPRVQRIDLEYTYPAALGLAPRVDEDSGDIFAPLGTNVRIRVHTDGDVTGGQMVLGTSQTIALNPEGRVLSGALSVSEDGSYRIGLVARDGASHPGDSEYYIRVLDDRPPDVRILKPARDREVTRLEEVDIEVQARDDFGLERLELVYAVAGGAERAVRFDMPSGAPEATGARTLYLEDLGVSPGDFITYYVRARDRAVGRASREARSDIFFLQVRPFDQRFTLAQSQSSGGGGGPNLSIDDLVAAQKEIIVATWKLDRRAETTGSSAEEDVRSVARAEAELKARVEAASSGLRTATMRDPRRPALPGAGPRPPVEEDAMTAAALALGRAVTALEGLDTTRAIPPEMEALTHLLRAQGEAGERQITQQAAGTGGGNRTSQDLSGLFDRELQRRQQTTYETRTNAERRDENGNNALEDIRELARRQDELLRRQEELARERERMAAEAMKRELERLTREQAELRQQAEELARQMAQQEQGQGRQGGRAGQGGQPGAAGEPRPGEGRQGAQSQGTQGSQGQSGQVQRAADEMARALNDLRRDDAAQAAARGGRALDQLRQLERQIEQAQPDERRRAMGEMQLEAQEIADAERRLAEALAGGQSGQSNEEAARRLAGEQERLAERASQLQAALDRQAGNPPGQGDPGAARAMQDAARDAAREMAETKLVDRMRQEAGAMRDQSGSAANRRPDLPPSREALRRTAEALAEAGRVGRNSEDFAQAFDRIADRLADARAAGNEDARRLTSQLTRAEALRERIERLSRELERQDEQARQGAQLGDGAAQSLRDDLARQVEEARELLRELQRESADANRGGVGVTFEGQGMVLSAPGTEAFKQDFARWESLRQQITQALEAAGTSIAARLNAERSRDRLTSGGSDRAPAQYRDQTDSYFRAIAGRQP